MGLQDKIKALQHKEVMTLILSNEYDRLVVENSETGEEIAVITRNEVTTADDKIVVRLKPSED